MTLKIAPALVLAASFAALLQTTTMAAVPPPLPAAVATFNVGSLHVQQYGGGPRSIIFIPGLTCGPWEWSGQIARLSSQYTVYALTLPGFDGQPPISGPLFDTTTSDFWRLLQSKNIVKPIVIGHSLGGTMAFMLATQHPDLLGGVIALDGLPILPGLNFMTDAQRNQMASQTQAQIAKESQGQFAAYERNTAIPEMVTSPQDARAIATLAGKSDPAETARWLAEDMRLDLRSSLPKATVPILLIAPFDLSVDGQFHMTKPDDKRAFYASLVAGAPDLQIDMIDHSRHFAMYDQPQAVNGDIAAFLSKVGR